MKKLLLLLPLCALLFSSCEKEEIPVFTKATVETTTVITKNGVIEKSYEHADTLLRAEYEK